jgi:hypothetical protein
MEKFQLQKCVAAFYPLFAARSAQTHIVQGLFERGGMYVVGVGKFF